MINVEVIRTERALTELRDEWTELLAQAASASIFVTWEWITTWWRHYGQDYELNILAARDENDALVGIAPLMVAKTGWGPLALRRLVFIGTGIIYPAHLDIIMKSGQEEAVSRALLAYLSDHRREWDLLELVSITENSPFKSSLAASEGHYSSGYPMPCAYLSLSDDWDSYVEQRLSPSSRKDLKYHQRRIQRDFSDQVVFEQVSNPEAVKDALTTLKDLQIDRWGGEGMMTPFESEQYVTFHEDVATTLLKEDMLRLFVLRIADEIVAVNYCFRYRDVYYGYQRAYNPEWKKNSPGKLVVAYGIECAINEGMRELDMLHGEKGDKGQWDEEMRFDARIRFSQGIKGTAALLGATLFDDTVAASRKHLPDSVRQQAGRLVPKMQW